MGLPGVRIVPSDGIRPCGGTGPQQGNVVAVPDGVKGNFRPPPATSPAQASSSRRRRAEVGSPQRLLRARSSAFHRRTPGRIAPGRGRRMSLDPLAFIRGGGGAGGRAPPPPPPPPRPRRLGST